MKRRKRKIGEYYIKKLFLSFFHGIYVSRAVMHGGGGEKKNDKIWSSRVESLCNAVRLHMVNIHTPHRYSNDKLP